VPGRPLDVHLSPSLVALLAAGAIAGCGGGDDDGGGGDSGGDRYPQAARENFVRSCDEQPNAERSVCECALERLEETVPFEDFEAADTAIREGEEPDKATSEKLTAAVERCVEEEQR
jgi:hypothetical protein